MWKKLKLGDKTYIIRTSAEDNSHRIMLSDFTKVWIETLNEQDMLLRCKELNPLFEAEPEVLVKNIKGLIEPDKHNVKKEIIEAVNQLTISFSSYLNGILFRFQFILTVASSEMFYQNLTFPLIQIIEELQARQKGLCDLLLKKDIEINEYKMEGAKLTRKTVITEPFNEQKFLERCSSDVSENRSAINLNCPYLFFEQSCSKLYEECTKRTKVIENALSTKTNNGEDNQEDVQLKEKPQNSKRKKINEITYDDTEDETEDDETYFSSAQAAVPKKPELKNSDKSKKRKPLNL